MRAKAEEEAKQFGINRNIVEKYVIINQAMVFSFIRINRNIVEKYADLGFRVPIAN